MIDKNGIPLKVGDWVLYPWWNNTKFEYEYFCDRIISISKKYDDIIFVNKLGSSTAYLTEKMPHNKVKREQLLFLKRLES